MDERYGYVCVELGLGWDYEERALLYILQADIDFDVRPAFIIDL